MNKIKIKINNLVSYSIGQVLLSIGVVLAIKSSYGVTVATAVAYVLSEEVTRISFGTFTYFLQGIIFILMLIILKTKNPVYLLSFATAIVTGYMIDSARLLMSGIMLDSHLFRSAAFVSSIFIISTALVFFIKSDVPILPFDMFVKKVTDKYNMSLAKFKMGFDIANLLLAIILCFYFFGQLNGIYLGTVISALTIGPCIGFVIKIFDKCITITKRNPTFRTRRVK